MVKIKKKLNISDYVVACEPLFTGNCIHDSSVTEYEKAAEVSLVIFHAVVNKLFKMKDSTVPETEES